MLGAADWNDMLADEHNSQQEVLKLLALYHKDDKDEPPLTFLEHCDSNRLDPEEELFYQHADYQHDLDR
jgi:hypothetical protein